MEISKYNHKIIEIVKFHEVDMLGVCNNAVYFNYFEDARIKYIQDLKRTFGLKEILEGNSFFIMVHNECDYIDSAHLDDVLNIYTCIDFIKNSSFGFKHIVENAGSNKLISRGGGIIVHIDKLKKSPVNLPEEFYKAVQKFESQVQILKNSIG